MSRLVNIRLTSEEETARDVLLAIVAAEGRAAVATAQQRTAAIDAAIALARDYHRRVHEIRRESERREIAGIRGE